MPEQLLFSEFLHVGLIAQEWSCVPHDTLHAVRRQKFASVIVSDDIHRSQFAARAGQILGAVIGSDVIS